MRDKIRNMIHNIDLKLLKLMGGSWAGEFLLTPIFLTNLMFFEKEVSWNDRRAIALTGMACTLLSPFLLSAFIVCDTIKFGYRSYEFIVDKITSLTDNKKQIAQDVHSS